MSGTLLYRGDHRCSFPGARPGAVWQCECGAVWRMHSAGQVWMQVGPLGRWSLRRKGILPRHTEAVHTNDLR